MASDNAVLKAIHERRSIRKFQDDQVHPEQVGTILDAARWAPSGLNNQPWRFLVVYSGDPRQKVLAENTKYGRIVENAKALVIVFLDKQNMYDYTKDCQGIGACVQNMLLAAHSLGLGAVWLGEILNRESEVMQGLNLDQEKYQLMAVVALGYPAEKGHSDRRQLKELILEDYT
ncbi:MAG: nitroreductase family protein [Thermodesulfobacteriota bacterium]